MVSIAQNVGANENYIVPYSLLWRAERTMEHVHGSMVKADDGW
jgi:hypothetical protein